uniref:Uncharacterized protein n=1 Tax=Rhizophora mucronata TaxID=61149 RepID=A0A2P2LQB3_RHIMU
MGNNNKLVPGANHNGLDERYKISQRRFSLPDEAKSTSKEQPKTASASKPPMRSFSI